MASRSPRTPKQDTYFMCKYFTEGRTLVLRYNEFVPRGHLPTTGGILGCEDRGRELLASRGWRPWMVLNTPQFTGENYPQMSTYIFSKGSGPNR